MIRLRHRAGETDFDAFISYSHAADGATALAVQRALQRFAKPWYRLRALRIFRDEASLAADPALWSSIARALGSSRYFLLLASPEAADSEWVAREAAYWQAHKPLPNLLLVLTHGELVWDAAAGDFDWERTTSMPRSLRGMFTEEPRFVDLRWVHDDTDLSLSHPRFRDAVADLAAPLHGRPKDEIAGEEVRQHRRTIRIARAAATILVALTAAATFFAFFALSQRNHAVSARRRDASRLLASIAVARMNQRLDLGLLVGVGAYRLAPTDDARTSIFAGVMRSRAVAAFLPRLPGGALALAFGGGDRVLVAGGAGGITVFDVPRRRKLAVLALRNGPVRSLAVSSDGLRVAFVDAAGGAFVWQPTAHSAPRPLRAAGGSATSVAFDPRGGFAVGTRAGKVLFLAPDGTLDAQLVTGGHEVFALAFSRSGRLLAAGGADGLAVSACNLSGGCRAGERFDTGEVVQSVALRRDGRVLVSLANDGHARVWRLDAPRPQEASGPVTAAAVAIAPSGMLARATGSGVIVVSPAGGGAPATVTQSAGSVGALAADASGRLLASAGFNGTVVLWRVPAQRTAAAPGSSGGRELDALAYAQDGRLALAGRDEVVVRDPGGETVARLSAPGGGAGAQLSVGAAGTIALVRAGTLDVWDGGGRHLAAPPVRGPIAAAFVPSTRDLAVGTETGRLELWRVAAGGRRLGGWPVGQAPVQVVAAAPTRLVAAGSADGEVTAWDLAHEPRRLEIRRAGSGAVTALAVADDGSRIAFAAADEPAIGVWDARTRRLRHLPGREAGVVALAFVRDDPDLLVAGDAGGRIAVWSLTSGRALGPPIPVGAGAVTGIAFSPSGRTLAAATADGSLELLSPVAWDADAAIARICAIVGRPLDRREWQAILPDGPYPRTCGSA